MTASAANPDTLREWTEATDEDEDAGDDPYDFPGYSRSTTHEIHRDGAFLSYWAAFHDGSHGGKPAIYEVDEDAWRIIDQYEAARRRQAEAQVLAEQRWKKRYEPPPPPAEPEPEAIPPGGKLNGRQEAFCREYTVQPIATRAAALAGYSENCAATLGSRLLKNPLVLARIAELRDARSLHYVLERDTMHDKLEAVFFDALGERNHAAAVSALRLQAGLGGLLARVNADGSPEAGSGGTAPAARKRRRGKVEKSRGRGRKKVEKSGGGRARKVEKRR